MRMWKGYWGAATPSVRTDGAARRWRVGPRIAAASRGCGEGRVVSTRMMPLGPKVSRLAIALLLLPFLGAEVAHAIGAFKRPVSTEKDAFIVVGEVFYIGNVDDWALFDPVSDPPTNLLADGSPGTDAAREHLDMVGIDLGTVASVQAKASSSTTTGGVTEHSISSLAVTVGELVFSDFDTNVEMETAEADLGPYAETVIQNSCSSYFACDWLWGQAFDPLSTDPDDTTLEMDSSYASGAQRGVNIYAGGDVGALPTVDGDVETTWTDGPAYLLVDLLVDDLPATWVTANGDNVRVVATIDYGVYYYAVYVPAMSLRGGAVLVMAVLAAGLLVLALPRKRVA